MQLLLREVGCTDCIEEWGPPPDSILSIPPPPFPNFIPSDQQNESVLCTTCVWAPTLGTSGIQFIELPRQGSGHDAWLMVLGACILGVLFLGAMFAALLLKCRARYVSKTPVPHAAVTAKPKGCQAILYPYPVPSQELWAAITAKGTTQHFTAPIKPRLPPPEPPVSFDSSGFAESDSQTPLMESYQLSELIDSDSTSSGGTMRTRLRVSTPTKIECPNLPPLNTMPHHGHRTIRRATLHRKESDPTGVL